MATAEKQYPRVVRTFEENGIKMKEIEDEMTDKGKVVVFTFSVAANAENMIALAKSSEENGTLVYKRYYAASDLAGRAGSRERAAAESTVFKRDGKEIDLMTLDPAKVIPLVNNKIDEVTVFGGKIPGAFAAYVRKIVEAGKATLTDGGKLKLKK